MKSRHAYDMLMQNLNAQIAQGENDRVSKAEDEAKAPRAKADAESADLAVTHLKQTPTSLRAMELSKCLKNC